MKVIFYNLKWTNFIEEKLPMPLNIDFFLNSNTIIYFHEFDKNNVIIKFCDFYLNRLTFKSLYVPAHIKIGFYKTKMCSMYVENSC